MILESGAGQRSVSSVADTLRQTKPHLKEMLDVYEIIFLHQENQFATLGPFPENPVDDRITNRASQGLALMTRPEIPVDIKAARKLFQEMITACLDRRLSPFIEREESLRAVIAAGDSFDRIVDSYLKEQPDAFDTGAKETGMDAQTLEFLIVSSLKPWVLRYSKALAPALDSLDHEGKGVCPVCGSHPCCSLLKENGVRFLVCSSCFHEWKIQRILCPFCMNQDAETLGYVVVDDDKGMRADLCDGCKRYLKTFDLREYQRDLYIPLELLAAIPLEMNLLDQGYHA